MKNLKKNHAIFLVTTLLLATFISCNKHKEDPENPKERRDNSLHFTIQGVQDIVEAKSDANSKSSKNFTDPMSKSSKIVKLNGLDAIMTLSEVPSDAYQNDNRNATIRPKNNSNSTFSSENKAATSTQLGTGVHYLVVLYKADANGNPTELLDQAEGIVGSGAISIPAYRNTKYRWYAITYNNTSTINKITANQTTVPVVPSSNSGSKRQDFAYSTGLITTGDQVGGTSSINNIILVRKTARLIVDVNSIGMFGPITYASPKFKDNSGLMKANFKIINATYENPSTTINNDNVYNHHTSGFSVPVGTDSVPEANWRRRYTFYTPANGTTSNLQVSLDTLKITSQVLSETDGSKYPVERLFTNLKFSFPNTKLDPGKSYFISIKLVESAINIESTSWARHNVYRLAENGIRPDGTYEYRFRYDNPNFQSIDAAPHNTDMFVNDIYNINGKNICERIYPEGVWDLPSEAQFNELKYYAAKNRIVDANSNWKLRFTPITLGLGAPSYPHGELDFSPMGYKETSTGPVLEFYPNSFIRYTLTKGYFRSKVSNIFAQLNYTFILNYQFEVLIMTERRSACIRCVRKK